MSNTYSGKDGKVLSTTGEQVAQITNWTWEEMVGINPSVTSRTAGYTQKNTGALDARGTLRYLIDRNNAMHLKAGDRWTVKLMGDPEDDPNDYIQATVVIASRTIIADVMTGADIGGDCTFEVDGSWTPNGRFAATALT